MTTSDRDRARMDAWLLPTRIQFAGLECRPLSLGSLLLCERLEIDFGKLDDPDWAEEMVLRYLWAHAEPLQSVLWSTWDESWEDALEAYSWAVDVWAHVEPVSDYVRRIFGLMDALWVKIAPRTPGSDAGAGAEQPPAELLAPDFRAALLADAGLCLPGMSEEALLWELPVPRMLTYHHTARWRDGAWTVPMVAGRASQDQIEAAKAAIAAARPGTGPVASGGLGGALALLERLSAARPS